MKSKAGKKQGAGSKSRAKTLKSRIEPTPPVLPHDLMMPGKPKSTPRKAK